MDYNTKQFIDDLSCYGLELSEKQINQFLRYYELLVEWNEFMNLTAITEYDEVMKKHFVDSLSLIRVLDCNKIYKVIDVGTGAGFPGLALKIAFPMFHVKLLDSLQKRVQFLNKVIEELGLENIDVVHGRAEDFAKPDKLREQYDICVSRAVANLATLSEYCLPYVKVGGYFIPYKSEKAEEEIEAGKKAISILGGKIEKVYNFTLPNTDYVRNLIMIKKEKSTNKKYPRKAGLPSKEPLK